MFFPDQYRSFIFDYYDHDDVFIGIIIIVAKRMFTNDNEIFTGLICNSKQCKKKTYKLLRQETIYQEVYVDNNLNLHLFHILNNNLGHYDLLI